MRLKPGSRSRQRAEAESVGVPPEGEPAHGPRKGALTVGAADGYQFRDDHSWGKDRQADLVEALEGVAAAAEESKGTLG